MNKELMDYLKVSTQPIIEAKLINCNQVISK